MRQSQISKKLKKPQLTQKQILEIQWMHTPKNKKAIHIGRYKQYWVVSQNLPDSPVLVYDQNEWDAFIEGVKNKEFDDLLKT